LKITEFHGCFASNEAKELLKELGLSAGITAEEAYRIVQLAAFNAFDPGDKIRKLREELSDSWNKANELLIAFPKIPRPEPVSIQYLIAQGSLCVSSELGATETDVQRWNQALRDIFTSSANLQRWNEIFSLPYLLQNEKILFQEILGLAA